MEIGIVFMDPKHIYDYIPNAILYTGYTPVSIIFTTTNDVLIKIKNSNIKYWIFSGSAHTVIMDNSPQIPIEIFDIPDKEFLMICYSMESTLFQNKYQLKKRYQNKNEEFKLKINMDLVKKLNKEYIFNGLTDKLSLQRNHHWYIPSLLRNTKNNKLFKEVASYRGESMMIFFKNAILVQYHPERTTDGKILIKNWINNKTT